MTTRALADGNEIPLLGLGVWQVPNGRSACTPSAGRSSSATATSTPRRRTATRRASAGRCATAACRARRSSSRPSSIPAREDPVAEAKRSLERLGVDYVDLYIIHWPAGRPDLGVAGHGARPRELGYARSIGVSNFGVERARRAARRSPRTAPVVNQVQFSPFEYRARCSTRARSAASRSRPTARSAPAATSPTGASARSPSASGARPRRSSCAGACSASSSSSRSRRTASGSRRTPQVFDFDALRRGHGGAGRARRDRRHRAVERGPLVVGDARRALSRDRAGCAG